MKNAIYLFTLGIICFSVIAVNAQDRPSSNWSTVDSAIHDRWQQEITKSNDLPYPYVGAFKGLPFIFYWDTYFINKGLTADGLDSLAKNNTEDLLFVVDRFGYMGNAAITSWGMTRAQPPFLSAMVWDVFLASNKTDTDFIKKAYPVLLKEYRFWTNSDGNLIEDHQTSIKGLQRYGQHAGRQDLITLYGELANRFSFLKETGDEQKKNKSLAFAVEAETGMDFTPRFEHRCPDFVALDLNCLLYNYEINFSRMAEVLGLKGRADWDHAARQRKKLINKYCWDARRRTYMDYDFVKKRPGKIVSATCLMPLWAGIATPWQAAGVVKSLRKLETNFGLVTVDKTNKETNYQWGPTAIWAPLQLIAMMGLHDYGYDRDASRIASKYLDLVSMNYRSPIPERYRTGKGTTTRSPGQIYEKYRLDGNINDDEYPAGIMMGWTAATFTYGYKFITHQK